MNSDNTNKEIRTWFYNHFRAMLEKNGKPFAICTPDGKNDLAPETAAELTSTLNAYSETVLLKEEIESLVKVVDELLLLPNIENRCGPWRDVRAAIKELKSAREALDYRVLNTVLRGDPKTPKNPSTDSALSEAQAEVVALREAAEWVYEAWENQDGTAKTEVATEDSVMYLKDILARTASSYAHLAVVPREELEALQAARRQHDELVYAVSMVHPDESRHETALRYIRERESPDTDRESPDTDRERSADSSAARKAIP